MNNDEYYDEPEPQPECPSCSSKMKNGKCPYCDVPEHNNDERIDG